MRFITVGLIICQITVHSQGDKFGAHLPRRAKNHEREILEATESRYRTAQRHPERHYSNYNSRITRKEFDLPHYERSDYWKKSHEYPNERTFYEDFSPDKTFPGIYQYMSSIFNGRDEITSEYPETYHYNHNRATPYKYVTPFRFTPTEPNYIPPPKPIRASVIKLETITRSPIYPPFEYETTPKYYPHVKTIINQVLIENSRAQRNGSWYAEEPVERVPPFRPLPVLPKPEYIHPTTLKPTYPGFFHDPSSFEYHNRTDYKYPDSVQDQLPHLNVGEVEIPYVSEKPIPHIFSSAPTEKPLKFGYDFFPSSDSSATTNILGLVDVGRLNSPGAHPKRRERPGGGVNVEFGTTTGKSFPGAVEKVKRPTFKYTKKLTAQLDKSPVERVTNLTVLGFSKKGNVDPPTHVNYLNVRKLINFEMDKLENTSQTVSITKEPDGSMRPVNLNDELSLDAKILKDTNWDGLTASQTTTTTTTEVPTTTFQLVRRVTQKSDPSKIAFWEIADQSTEASGSDVTETTTTEQTGFQTTTDFISWTSTETTETVTTDETTIAEKVRRRSETDREPLKPITEVTFEVTVPSERTTFRRRYSRRPKISSFTPYPTAEELRRKLVRNHFPKRQKPNITLTFGNKNVLKARQNLGKDEVIKFSDEDVRKRRKAEKRRHIYKRLRSSSSERPNLGD